MIINEYQHMKTYTTEINFSHSIVSMEVIIVNIYYKYQLGMQSNNWFQVILWIINRLITSFNIAIGTQML